MADIFPDASIFLKSSSYRERIVRLTASISLKFSLLHTHPRPGAYLPPPYKFENPALVYDLTADLLPFFSHTIFQAIHPSHQKNNICSKLFYTKMCICSKLFFYKMCICSKLFSHTWSPNCNPSQTWSGKNSLGLY